MGDAFNLEYCETETHKPISPSKRNQYDRQWKSLNRDKINEKARANYKKNGHRRPAGYAKYKKDFLLKWKFGISSEEYEKILDKQGGVCAICRKPERVKRMGKIKSLSVDHCHNAGHVRGLLCQRCNQAIGFLDNSAQLAEAAAKYLNKEIIFNP